MFLIDSHCHLDKLNYTLIHRDIISVLNKSRLKNVRLVLSVATTLMDFYNLYKDIGNRNDVLFSCGIHPLNIDKNYDFFDEFCCLAQYKNVVAIGETGLDYYRSSDTKLLQQEVFRQHISISCEYKKPLIIHTRNSHKDILKILGETQLVNCAGIVHCFTETKDIAKLFLNLGFYVSFSGIITFSLSNLLFDTINYVPLDRILIETDSPYLTPVPYRGQENQPAYVYKIAEYLAKLKGISLEELSIITTDNFCRLFNLDKEYLIIQNNNN